MRKSLSLLAGALVVILTATNPPELSAHFIIPRGAVAPRVPVRPVMPMNNMMNRQQPMLPNPLLASVLLNRLYYPYAYNPYAYGNYGYPYMPAYSPATVNITPAMSYSNPYMMYMGSYGGYTPSYTGSYGYGQTPSSQMSSYYSAPANSPSYANPYLPAATPASGAPTAQTATTPAVQAARTVDVGVFDDYFEPTTYAIKAGTTVRWTNRGTMRHTVTSDLNLWDASELAPGGATRFTFLVPGTYTYYCSFHSRDMRGVIVVE